VDCNENSLVRSTCRFGRRPMRARKHVISPAFNTTASVFPCRNPRKSGRRASGMSSTGNISIDICSVFKSMGDFHMLSTAYVLRPRLIQLSSKLEHPTPSAISASKYTVKCNSICDTFLFCLFWHTGIVRLQLGLARFRPRWACPNRKPGRILSSF
jgi:hypothetical protein